MKLHKGLNLLDVMCISSGAMLSGLFILPGLAFAQAGPAILLAFAVAGVLAMTGMLSQAELASAMPKAGGTYFYVTRSMGPGVGTIYGLVTWLSLTLKSAFELAFAGAILGGLIGVNAHLLAAGLCILFVAINMVGVKQAGRVQAVLVAGLLIVLAYYTSRAAPSVRVASFDPFLEHDWPIIFSTAGFVFISFGGLLKVASVGEEVKDPGYVLPRGMIGSLVLIGIVYLLVIFVTIGAHGKSLAGAAAPLSDSGGLFLGSSGQLLMSIAAMVAVISAANTGIMAASRYPLALARDDMAPELLGRINQRFRTPHVAILATGLLILACVFLNIEQLVKAASSVLILTYAFPCLAVVILRESHLQNYHPRFRSPLYPLLPILGIVGLGFLLFQIGIKAMMLTLVLIVGGLFVYWFYGRIRATREYALLHLIERITARELTTHSLETELKQIVRERDAILEDRFDRIIENCCVLDIDRSMSYEELFGFAAVTMEPRLHVDAATLEKLLLDRERDSSTVLSPTLAIPHIIIDGEHTFDVLLARCRDGIVFSDAADNVHTVFFLIGTSDERTFHLRALAAIAQIVQDPHFERAWMAAKTIDALRDTVLLAERARHVEI